MSEMAAGGGLGGVAPVDGQQTSASARAGALALLAAGRYADAAATARSRLAADPADVSLLIVLAASLTSLGEADAAVDAATRAIAAAPEQARCHGALGDAHLIATRKYRRAIDAYNEAARIDPMEPSYFTGRAQATLHIVPERRRSTPPKPGAAWASRRNGGALLSARRDAEHARRLDPNSATVHVVMAKVLMAEGRQLTARQAVEYALRLDPSNVVALQVSGLALQQVGDVRGASESFVSAARHDPRSNTSLNLLRNMRVSVPIGAFGTFALVRIAAASGVALGFPEWAAGLLAVVVLGSIVGWDLARRRRLRREFTPAARDALQHDRQLRRSDRLRVLRRLRRIGR